MNCPCCALGEVSGQTDTCNLCGYSMKANVATQSGGQKDTSAADPAKSVVKVTSRGMAGNGTAITVTLKDGNGKPLAAGSDRVVVAVTGANRGRPRVTDVGNGTYTATYTPVFAGRDQLGVTLNGSTGMRS